MNSSKNILQYRKHLAYCHKCQMNNNKFRNYMIEYVLCNFEALYCKLSIRTVIQTKYSFEQLFKQNIYSNNKCGLKNHRFHQNLSAGKMLIKVISWYLTSEKKNNIILNLAKFRIYCDTQSQASRL